MVSSALPHNIKYIILNSGDITKRYSVDAQNLIPAKFATLEVLLMGKWFMMSAKKWKSPPFSPPYASTTIWFHSDPPSHVIQQTFINELQRTILSPLERRSFGIFLIKLWQWDQCTYSITFLSDKAHNIYKYLKCIQLTGKREYVRREMKRVSHLLCVHHRNENQTSFKQAA